MYQCEDLIIVSVFERNIPKILSSLFNSRCKSAVRGDILSFRSRLKFFIRSLYTWINPRPFAKPVGYCQVSAPENKSYVCVNCLKFAKQQRIDNFRLQNLWRKRNRNLAQNGSKGGCWPSANQRFWLRKPLKDGKRKDGNLIIPMLLLIWGQSLKLRRAITLLRIGYFTPNQTAEH